MELHKPCFTKNQEEKLYEVAGQEFFFPLWHDRKQRTDLWEVLNHLMFQSLNWIKQLLGCPSKLHVIILDGGFLLQKGKEYFLA